MFFRNISNVLPKYSTTQPICSLKERNNDTYFFFEDDRISGEYLIANKDIQNLTGN